MFVKKIIFGFLLHAVTKMVNMWKVLLKIQSLRVIKLYKQQKPLLANRNQ